MTLSPNALKILDAAIALCQAAKWSTCEPIAVLTTAAESLSLAGCSAEITEIQRRERMYAPVGSLWNHFQVRLDALSAVRRFADR